VSALSQPQTGPSIQQAMALFQEILPAEVIETLLKAAKVRSYKRLFTPLITVWCFFYQRFNSDHTLDAVVSHVGSGAVDHLDQGHLEPFSQRMKSENTAALSKARKRLPLSVLIGILRHLAKIVRQRMGEQSLWLGHPVAVLDGSTLQLTPESELVEKYGQPSNQHGPCYWVVMRVVVAFCLRTATVLAFQDGPTSKGEKSLVAPVLSQLEANTVCLGDSNFGIFAVAQAARHYKLFPVVRLMSKRAHALVRRDMDSGEDIRVAWAPSQYDQYDQEMSTDPIEGRLLYVHLERNGFRPVDLYLFTTLLDPTVYTLAELVKLYGCRWRVELYLRNVKATLDMDMLMAKTVEMVRKELCAGLIAYSIIRAWMVEAGQQAKLSPEGLSFTKCWRRVRDALASLRPEDGPEQVAAAMERLVIRLSKCVLQKRVPFRIEPRAVRRRPQVYPALKGSRAAARELAAKQLQEPVKC